MVDYKKLLKRCMQQWVESEGCCWSGECEETDAQDGLPDGFKQLTQEEITLMSRLHSVVMHEHEKRNAWGKPPKAKNRNEPEAPILGMLTVYTDWDFSVISNEILFSESKFTLIINSVEHLKSLQLRGPFGADNEPEKRWEWDQAMERIFANPTEGYCNAGGNRGVDCVIYKDNNLE